MCSCCVAVLFVGVLMLYCCCCCVVCWRVDDCCCVFFVFVFVFVVVVVVVIGLLKRKKYANQLYHKAKETNLTLQFIVIRVYVMSNSVLQNGHCSTKHKNKVTNNQ